MTGRPSLLEAVRGLIERTYGMNCGLGDLGAFVIGDRRYLQAYIDQPTTQDLGAASGGGAKTLVRETPEGVRVCVYYPDELIRRLEEHPPQLGLNDANVQAFATLVEELDHLLLIAERVGQTRPLSLFELELHANVTKYLVLARFLSGAEGRLSERARQWLIDHLFDKVRFCEREAAVRKRYEDAVCWAVRFLRLLSGMQIEPRLNSLRRFHRTNAAGKLELINQLAA